MFDPYTPISFPMLSFPRPCYHLYYPPNFVLHILPLSFSHPPSSPFLRFSPEWRVLRHCRACIASLFQARAPRLLFPRLPHRLLLRVLPSSSLSPSCFIHHFRRGRLVVSTRETPPSFFFFFSSSFFLPLPFHFIPFFSARTQTYRTTSRFTSLGDMSFSTLVEPGSLSLPRTNRPLVTGRVSRWNDGVGFVFVDEGQGATDGWETDRVSFFFISFLFFFWKSLLSLIENCFSSENRSLRGALF